MSSNKRKFSSFLTSTLLTFEAIALSLVLGVLYVILSRSITQEYYHSIHVQQTEIKSVLQNRLTALENQLRELSLNNTIRINLMLGLNGQVQESLENHFPTDNGAHFFILDHRTNNYIPNQFADLELLQTHLLPVRDPHRVNTMQLKLFDNQKVYSIWSIPIQRKNDILATAFVVYNIDQDHGLWDRVDQFEHSRLYLLHSTTLFDLRSGKSKPFPSNLDDKYTGDGFGISINETSDELLMPLLDPRSIYYASSVMELKHKKQGLIALLFGICVAVFILTRMVTYFITHRVSGFLNDMVRQARQIARSPDPNALNEERIRYAEFHQLAKSFNIMLHSLRTTQEKLKQRNFELNMSERRYRKILESIEDGYYEIDLKGKCTFCNDALARILGYEKNDLIDSDLQQYLDQANTEKLFHELAETLVTGRSIKGFECELRRKDNSRIAGDISISVMRSESDHKIGFRGILRDVTHRKKGQALQREKLRAEAANQAKSNFLAKMSHEIRTPLNAIIGMAEVAMATRLDENQQRLMTIIQHESDALLHLINEVLDFSKIEAGKLEIELIPFNLQHLLEEVGESFALNASQQGLELNIFLEPSIPHKVIGDPTRLRQVLLNLVNNALKFTSDGEIFIQGTLDSATRQEAVVRFMVKDTGIGIPVEKQRRIFESFTQADDSTTREYGGTGLGTTISKELVELMGGQIGIDNNDQQGSAFWFTVLFGIQPAAVEQVEPQNVAIDLDGLRTLIVDDSSTSLKINTKIIETINGKVSQAMDGPQALDLIIQSMKENQPFELIITDFSMPGMSGFELAQQVRLIDAFRQTPIIAISGLQEIIDGTDFRHYGFDRCLAKPLKVDEIKTAITEVLRPSEPTADTVSKMSWPTGFSPDTPCNPNGKDILLVEDYPANQQVAKMHLTAAGYTVDLAENGQAAVVLFARKAYNVVLMDLEMPIMDGYTAARQIRRLEARLETDDHHRVNGQAVPIVAITAHALKGLEEKCLQAGMNDFMTKPLRRKNLLAMVSKWTGGAEIEDDPSEEKLSGQTGDMDKENQNSPMDWQQAMEEFMGEKEVLLSVLTAFQETARSQIHTIEDAIKNVDAETVRREAHALKGGAANLTAEHLADRAYELETMARTGQMDNSSMALAALDSELNRFERFVSSITQTT